jgi:hypothetical protein
MHYFSTTFWYKTLHVSDRLTVHHHESWYCIHSNWYLSYWNFKMGKITSVYIAVNTVSRLLIMGSTCVRNMELYIKIKLRNSVSCFLLLYVYITMHDPQNFKFTRYTTKHLAILLLTQNFREDGQIKLRSTTIFIV